MTVAARKTQYDRVFDRWTEKDNDYAKVNPNRDLMTTFFRSDEIIDTDEKGNLVGQSIYTGSPSWDARTMSTGFQGSMVSKNIDWIRYQMNNTKLRGLDQLDIILQNMKEHMASAYQLSNFYKVQHQFTLEGVTTGSPVMFGEEDLDKNRTMWLPQHYKTVRVYYNKFNEPEGVMTQDKTWTVKQVVDEFTDGTEGDIKKKLSISTWSSWNSMQLDDVVTLYRATFKYNDPIWDGIGDGAFKKPSAGTPEWEWISVYFEELTTADLNKKNIPLNDNMGDFSQPFAVWNFDKKPWEASSRTPAWYGLWDNLSLQQIEKNYMEDIQTTNRNPMIALASMGGRLQLGPEGEMLVSKDEYDRPPKPVDRIGGIQFSQELMEMKAEASRRWFMTDFFAKFTNMIQTNKQPVSAAQIWQMAGEKATMLSPAIEAHSEYLGTMDARMIDIEIRAGRGPFSPDEMGNLADIIESVLGELPDDIEVMPVFIGPLAQAQKISQAVQPIQATLDVVDQVMAIWPEVRHKYRPSIITDHINEAFDFPQDAVVPEEEYQEIVLQERQAAIQAEQADQAIEAVKASKSLQGPVDETSVLAEAVA